MVYLSKVLNMKLAFFRSGFFLPVHSFINLLIKHVLNLFVCFADQFFQCMTCS